MPIPDGDDGGANGGLIAGMIILILALAGGTAAAWFYLRRLKNQLKEEGHNKLTKIKVMPAESYEPSTNQLTEIELPSSERVKKERPTKSPARSSKSIKEKNSTNNGPNDIEFSPAMFVRQDTAETNEEMDPTTGSKKKSSKQRDRERDPGYTLA